jgi:hypothetical protein
MLTVSLALRLFLGAFSDWSAVVVGPEVDDVPGLSGYVYDDDGACGGQL